MQTSGSNLKVCRMRGIALITRAELKLTQLAWLPKNYETLGIHKVIHCLYNLYKNGVIFLRK